MGSRRVRQDRVTFSIFLWKKLNHQCCSFSQPCDSVHSCLWVLWNPSIIVIPNFSVFSCQIKFLLKEAQITQKRNGLWEVLSHKQPTLFIDPVPVPSILWLRPWTEVLLSSIPSLWGSMLAANLQCPHSLTRVLTVLLPRSFLLFWNISVKLLCILSWSERAHCQKMHRVWYSVTPSGEFLTLIPLCCS